ncbi:MAG: ABC transporter permease, partial [Rubripirellula sp.]
MMMKHLLWKDARALQPLVVAIVICITAINLLLWLITSGEPNSSSSEGLFVVIWILMPNLAALGAPAILVGGEEEKGTLRWLRTLPVHWSKVANAKLLVSIGAIALVWVTASLALLVARLRFSLDITGNGFTFFHLSEGSAYTDSVLSLGGLTYLMFFNLLLLLLGFVTAYSFRSPLTALLAVIPAIVLTTVAFGAASRLIVLGEILDR